MQSEHSLFFHVTDFVAMENRLPYVAMVVSQFAQVGLLIASKEAILSGMSAFTFASYSSAIASLILLPSSFLLYRYRPYSILHKLGVHFILISSIYICQCLILVWFIMWSRSTRPRLCWDFLFSCFLIGLLGYVLHISNYIRYYWDFHFSHCIH